MSFLIKCTKCDGQIIVEDKGSYLANQTVDLLADEDMENGTTLELFCNNSECGNEAKINI